MKASSSLKTLLFAAAYAVLLMTYAPAGSEAAVSCNPVQLSSCLNAISYGTPPPPSCCSNLKQQQPCFCQYASNPSLSGYFNSPNAKKMANYCRVAFPKC